MKKLILIVSILTGSYGHAQLSIKENMINITGAKISDSYIISSGDTIHKETTGCDFDLSVGIEGSSFAIVNRCRSTVYSYSEFTQPMMWNEELQLWEMIKIGDVIITLQISPKDGWFRLIDIFVNGTTQVDVFYFEK